MKRLSLKDTAKVIRKKLKDAFPGTRFSVRCKTFSMGNSIDIHWTNGPTEPQVDKVVQKYGYGGFDGMTDSSYIKDTEITINGETYESGAKWIGTSRESTRVLYDAAFKIARDEMKKYGVNIDQILEVDTYEFTYKGITTVHPKVEVLDHAANLDSPNGRYNSIDDWFLAIMRHTPLSYFNEAPNAVFKTRTGDYDSTLTECEWTKEHSRQAKPRIKLYADVVAA